MRPKKIGFLFLVIGLSVVFTFTVLTFYSSRTQTDTVILEPSGEKTVKLDLWEKDLGHGAIQIIEGTGGVRLSLLDPAGEVVYDGGVVYTSLEFTFTADNSGVFSVHFKNLNGSDAQTVKCALKHPTIPLLAGIALIIAGSLLAASGVVVVLISYKKRN